MRALAAIDAEIGALLSPYGVTLEQLLPLDQAFGQLLSLAPLPPGCMDARAYLEQLDTYQCNVREAESKLCEAQRTDEASHLRRSLDLYEAKLYRFSRLWRPIDGEAFRSALYVLLRERIDAALSERRAEALALMRAPE